MKYYTPPYPIIKHHDYSPFMAIVDPTVYPCEFEKHRTSCNLKYERVYDIDHADAIIMPLNLRYHKPDRVDHKTIMGNISDRGSDEYPGVGIYLPTSWYHSMKVQGVIEFPYMTPYADYRGFKHGLSIGFCGWYADQSIRVRTINAAKDDKRLLTNFIIRQQFYAGMTSGHPDEPKVIEDYRNNISDNLYTLCPRGMGNTSMRLYETMMMARIPILIDTDCPRPFDHIINYDEHMVIVPEHAVDKLGDYVIKFHESHDVLQVQKTNRLIWEDHFSLLGAINTAHDIILDKIKNITHS